MSAGFVDPDSRIAGRAARAWVRAYTRNTAPILAEQRRAEIESDIWEQVNESELSGLAAGPILLWRLARGIPADLAWRRDARRGFEGGRSPLHHRWQHGGLLRVMAMEGLVLAALMLGTIVHILHGGGAGSLGPTTAGVVAALIAGLLLSLTGLGLLARARTRAVAPLVLGTTALIGLLTALPALTWISTTVAAFYFTSPLTWTHPGWSEVGTAAAALVLLLHVTTAIAWLPDRARSKESTR
jgi:hypothetical protein